MRRLRVGEPDDVQRASTDPGMKRSAKNRRRLPPWTPFEEATRFQGPASHDRFIKKMLVEEGQRVFVNSRYQVWVHEMTDDRGGTWTHLSIKNQDKSARHDWRDYQRIKNELCDPEREAVEIYPPESNLVDTANQFHLWVLPTGVTCPVGFRDRRAVSEAQPPGSLGSQRPWEPDDRPDDLLSLEEMEAAVAKMGMDEE
jgi:hypothetical protein